MTDEEWAFVAPYIVLMRPDAPQRTHDPPKVYNALRWIVRAVAPWRYPPGEFLPWEAVYQQTRRWIAAGCSETMVHDLYALLRWAEGRADAPSAVILYSRTVQIPPESGVRAVYDGHKRRKGSKSHLVVDTLGHLLVLPAEEQERAQVADLTAVVQEATGESVAVAFVDQGYTGAVSAAAAAASGIEPVVVRLP